MMLDEGESEVNGEEEIEEGICRRYVMIDGSE